jgi:hypothetical protein
MTNDDWPGPLSNVDAAQITSSPRLCYSLFLAFSNQGTYAQFWVRLPSLTRSPAPLLHVLPAVAPCFAAPPTGLLLILAHHNSRTPCAHASIYGTTPLHTRPQLLRNKLNVPVHLIPDDRAGRSAMMNNQRT